MEGKSKCAQSSFVYNRGELHTTLTAQELGISLELMICNKRILVLRLPHSTGLGLSQQKVFSGSPLFTLFWGWASMLGQRCGGKPSSDALEATPTIDTSKVRRVVPSFSPSQDFPGSPSRSRQEFG